MSGQSFSSASRLVVYNARRHHSTAERPGLDANGRLECYAGLDTAALILYAIAGACWLPVVWIQIRLRRIAHGCIDRGAQLPSRYWQLTKYWEWLATQRLSQC